MDTFDTDSLDTLAHEQGMRLDGVETATYNAIGEGLLELMATVEGLAPQPVPDPGVTVSTVDSGPDPLNAFVRRCHVDAPDASGPLDGVRVAVKDCIAVQGVEMTGGSSVLQGFIPTRNSTVVHRLLDAGASVEGITNMDCLAMSAAGDSSFYGPVLCPQDPTRLAGGSSGGSAAALSYDDIDLAIGTDTGGSVRVPSSWCGVLGLKPTYGLVSYRGVVPIDQRFDHVGPLARTAEELARAMGVIAGFDDLDPRQSAGAPRPDFAAAIEDGGQSLSGRKFGVLREGSSTEFGVQPEVMAAFNACLEQLRSKGASVEEVSVPEHLNSSAVMFSMLAEGFAALMSAGGNGYQWEGEYWPELADAVHAGRGRISELSDQVKLSMLVGQYLQRRYGGRRYAQAANARLGLRQGYDRALGSCDMILMPTVPFLQYPVEPQPALADQIMRSWGVLGNTSATNITGHPALSLPLGTSAGLPVGVMAVGRHHSDSALVSMAARLESEFGWNSVEAQ